MHAEGKLEILIYSRRDRRAYSRDGESSSKHIERFPFLPALHQVNPQEVRFFHLVEVI